jgi:CHAT domain-containing protein/tetratricopeptide (TPR) repeat protein
MAGVTRARVVGGLIALALALGPSAGAQAPEPPLERARALEAEVLRHIRSGPYREGIPKAREALALRERALGPAHPLVAASLDQLAELLRASGDYAAARPLAERALAVREQALGPAHPEVGLSLNNLAALLEEAGDPVAARPLHERAIALWEAALGPAHPLVATSVNNLGVLLYVTGEYERARLLHERALGIRERTLGADHEDTGRSLTNLALVLETTGRYAAARPLYERALAILERALGPDDVDVSRVLNNLAELLRLSGDPAGARRLHERALRIRERTLGRAHPLVATSLNNLAVLLAAQGDHAGARQAQTRALAVREQAFGPDHPEVATSLDNLAGLQALEGAHAEAGALRARALAIRERAFGPDHPEVGVSLTVAAGHRLDLGDRARARPLYERALDILRRSGLPEWRWRAAHGLGRIHEREGRLGEALPLDREAVETLETLAGQFAEDEARGRYLTTGNRLDAYDALTRVLLELHRLDPTRGHDRDAWAVLEARRGRIAAEALAAARPKFEDQGVRAEVERAHATQERALALERALREERAKPPGAQLGEKIRNLTTLLGETKAEYLAQVRAFLARYPRYKAQFVDQQVVDPRVLAKFAQKLPARALVVQYFAAPDRLYLFLVASGGQFRVKSHAVTQRALNGLVHRYRELVERGVAQRLPWADDGSATYRRFVLPLKEVTRQLAAHLLAPIEAELAAHPTVILVPNDLLLHLPIHALTRAAPGGRERFLAETHSVSYLTQLELVDLLTPRLAGPDVPLLALANPDGSLPGGSREVRALVDVRSRVTALDGADATKSRFLTLAGRFPDLHLATHGVLDAERPERSHLLLAADGGGTVGLGVDEIAGLSLPGGLAILSACETALGEHVPGAALITLAAAFSQAGAQSIVASLWKVNDAATRDLMVVLHQALPAGGRAAALRQAQRAVLANPATAHPFYWAGFILLGAR